MIRMQVHLLPFGGRECSNLRPYAIGDAYTTHIMEVRRDLETRAGSTIQAEAVGCRQREPGDIGSVTMCEGILEIGQLAEGASNAWQVRFAYLHDRRWFSVENVHTRIAARYLRDDCVADGCEVLYDCRVECLSRTVSQRVGDITNPETEQLRGLGGHARDARGSGDSLAA